MRVLHIHSGNLYGGVETLLLTLQRERAAAPALLAEYALCFEGRLAAELRAAGGTVHALGTVRASRPMGLRRARRALARLLREGSFDAAVCHAPWAQALLGQAARRAGVPVVFWMHAPARGRHWLERWARLVTPDLVLCNSRFTRDTAPRLYPRTRAEVVYCPVSIDADAHAPDTRAAIRAELETAAGATVIVQSSRMEEWKGHALHLQALGMLQDVPDWVCWIIGGSQRPDEARYLEGLKELAVRLGVSGRIRFAGERADVSRVLVAADIYCQPNMGPEPFGLAFVEALAAKLPVVTTSLGGVTEIVNETCGVLTEPADTSALAGALRSLILNKSLRTELGGRGPARARELCDPAAQLKLMSELFAGLPRRVGGVGVETQSVERRPAAYGASSD